MKKLGFVLLVLVLLFVPMVLAEDECNRNSDCNDDLRYTTDRCINPRGEDSYCTNEIRNSQYLFLNRIAELLQQLLDKPQGQVEVTFPEKECEWENYNIATPVRFGPLELTGDASLYEFIVPKEVIYSDFEVSEAWLLFECRTDAGCHIIINDNEKCDTIERDVDGSARYHKLSEECSNQIIEGPNKFSFSSDVGESNSVRVIEYYFKTQIKPSNC